MKTNITNFVKVTSALLQTFKLHKVKQLNDDTFEVSFLKPFFYNISNKIEIPNSIPHYINCKGPYKLCFIEKNNIISVKGFIIKSHTSSKKDKYKVKSLKKDTNDYFCKEVA